MDLQLIINDCKTNFEFIILEAEADFIDFNYREMKINLMWEIKVENVTKLFSMNAF